MLKKILLLFCVSQLFVLAELNHGYCETILTASTSVADFDSPEYKTRELEKIKANINYCLSNIGKKYSVLDEKQAGGFWPHKDLGVMTYVLIAQKYHQYGDGGKAGDYYYQNWLHYNTQQTGENRWPYPDGEYDDYFVSAMSSWEAAGKYKEMVEHYEDYLIHRYSPRFVGPKEAQIKEMQEEINSSDELKAAYQKSLKKFERYKKLSKTAKPKPLDPAVQNHEWFYSDKQAEVLKALAYYHVNKVKFMLEKALTHKDPIIAAKAKEYLDSLAKGPGK